MTRSVESRFIAIVSTALLVVVAPLFTLFLALSSQKATETLREQVRLILATNAHALGKPVWELDAESIRGTALAILAEPTVRSVYIDDELGKVTVVESDINPADFRGLETMSMPITYRSPDGEKVVGNVTVYVQTGGWFAALDEMEHAFIAIFVLAVLTVFLAAIFGNRMMVIQPLMRLTAAIEATRRLGSRHHVDWQSNDEMGRLAQSFNEMQTLLERDERDLRRAHRHATETYNRTPAMLFSLDGADLILAVSDYWLLATGYDREEIIGQPFIRFVVPADHQIFANRKTRNRMESRPVEATVRFMCKDGRVMDVLIVEREMDADYDAASSLNVMTDVTELRQSELRNGRLAITDHLTGLVNRQGFEGILEERIREADEAGVPLACLFVDLDRFKSVNDNFGHAAGDDVLQQFVERVRPLLREEDTLSRLGGDEFAILIGNHDAQAAAETLCGEIIAIFDAPFLVNGAAVRLSASVGVAFYPDHAGDAAELLHKSDLAMYTRKREGKNGAQIFDPVILDRTRQRAEIEHDIHEALDNDWFEAHFQPIVDTSSGEVAGFEALMRMRHPDKGLLSPAGIIEVAEETAIIGRIGDRILEAAIANLARLTSHTGMSDTYVAVNFSPMQFESPLPLRLVRLLDRYGILPHRLVVEITEAVLMHDNPEIRTILNEIHTLGCRIALDDFGTGYSSLSYMSRFPVDIVKIDQSFVRSIEDGSGIGQKNRMLVEGIAAISHKMNCLVVAEGVETAAQYGVLREIGIDCAQGYHFARPRQVDDILAELQQRKHIVPQKGS
ncbi:sensor domain-containing diguanylate cyclase [Pseudorhizobium endolithicum]|uniref:Sensor domain-containing diguanylate cyclase n=1 Tax=Pseudorhizobium endolithicum TaxID=1191678 RepID=A0ABM8PE75_9HYPH|nr:EAL domain-containing protein [Pseudorhizobium endolithicum]CAD7024111.1 sensor domain-containing diguanylate cyclase [Pseudorhizobium endolithicum]